MRITIKLFAVLRDRAGVDQFDLDLPNESTVDVAQSEIVSRYPSIADLMSRVAVAVNREYVKTWVILRDGDELALIPAVSGG